MEVNRRKFITTMAAAGAAVTTGAHTTFGLLNSWESKYPVYLFTKPLDSFENDFMGETLSMVGNLAGYDVTVRPGGKVEPEKVGDDLPKFVEDGRKYNLDTNMIVSAFSHAREPHIEKVLSTASSLGVKHYRMGYISYDANMDVWKFLQNLKSQIINLTAINKQFNIQAGYQNHAGGPRFGTALWDLWEILRDLPVEFMSSQFDVRHATVEGASSWVLALRLLKNKIGSLAIKDFNWEVSKGRARSTHVPLGEGLVDFDLYFQTLKEQNIQVPITLHVEYSLLSEAEEKLPLLQQQKILVSKIKKDVDFVRNYLLKYQLI
jgi:L-ribulose-5-phosphate 3-epimerase